MEKLTEETLRDQSHLEELLAICEGNATINGIKKIWVCLQQMALYLYVHFLLNSFSSTTDRRDLSKRNQLQIPPNFAIGMYVI